LPLALPLLLGAPVGAPLVAREVEQRTHLLVWTQSITRMRWLSVKLTLVLGAGLLAGLLIFAAVYVGFALVTNAALVWVHFAVYGAYISFTEGVGKALISDLAPQERRATAFGLYSALVGARTLPSSAMAGLLWDRVSPSAPFIFGACAAALAAALLWLLLPAKARESSAAG
jgi:MFS family permease